MKNEKNIDSIIREKLEGYSASPPPHIWDNVKRQLAAQKRKTRRMVIGWISTAAVVVLAFLAGWYFNDNSKIERNPSVKNEIIKHEERTTVTGTQSVKIASQNTIEMQKENNSKEIEISETATQIGFSQATSKKANHKYDLTYNNSTLREIVKMDRIEGLEAFIAQKQQSKPELERSVKSISVNSLTNHEQLLIAENIKNFKLATEPGNKWRMGMYVAPGYSSYAASHTESYAQNMTYSGSDGNTNVSGGASVQYKTSRRWIVESGVYYAQNGQETETSINLLAKNMEFASVSAPGDLAYSSNSVRVENNNLAMNSTAGVIQFSKTPKGAELSSDFEAANAGTADLLVPEGQFSQVFDFMEIPLYVRYRLIDSKVGVELITGLNAGIVIGNNAYIDNQYGIQNIGETKDISTLNLSGTLGVGMNYALGKHFSIAFEPRFNYYLNSINTNSSVEFRPYRIGFYSGVTYGF